MSYYFDVNNNAVTGTTVIFKLKELLKSCGWVVLNSSDGYVYCPDGDLINNSGPGKAGLENYKAWFRIQMPSIDSFNREFLFQRTNNTTWDILYSHSSGFINGTCSVLETPTALDQVYLSDNCEIFPEDYTYRINLTAGEEDEGFSFWINGFPIGGGNPNVSFFFLRFKDNIYSDNDPYFTRVFSNNSLYDFSQLDLSQYSYSWFNKNCNDESFAKTMALKYCYNDGYIDKSVFPGSYEDGYCNIIEIPCANLFDNMNYVFFKGYLNSMMWNGYNLNTADTLSISSNKDKIVYNETNFPWNGSEPLI
jgi:hypothetical protein